MREALFVFGGGWDGGGGGVCDKDSSIVMFRWGP